MSAEKTEFTNLVCRIEAEVICAGVDYSSWANDVRGRDPKLADMLDAHAKSANVIRNYIVERFECT